MHYILTVYGILQNFVNASAHHDFVHLSVNQAVLNGMKRYLKRESSVLVSCIRNVLWLIPSYHHGKADVSNQISNMKHIIRIRTK